MAAHPVQTDDPGGGGTPDADVLIAGAGPVGAALGLLLAARGVAARVIGRSTGRAETAGGLRPVALSWPSVELLAGSACRGSPRRSCGCTCPSKGTSDGP